MKANKPVVSTMENPSDPEYRTMIVKDGTEEISNTMICRDDSAVIQKTPTFLLKRHVDASTQTEPYKFEYWKYPIAMKNIFISFWTTSTNIFRLIYKWITVRKTTYFGKFNI